MRKPQKATGEPSAAPSPHSQPGELGKLHPRVADALCRSAWEDGTRKKSGEVLLKIRGGAWIAVLRLIGTGYQVEVEIPEPLLMWDALEAVLSLETVPWEENDYDWGVTSKKAKKA